jgi:hypothetical protein
LTGLLDDATDNKVREFGVRLIVPAPATLC